MHAITTVSHTSLFLHNKIDLFSPHAIANNVNNQIINNQQITNKRRAPLFIQHYRTVHHHQLVAGAPLAAYAPQANAAIPTSQLPPRTEDKPPSVIAAIAAKTAAAAMIEDDDEVLAPVTSAKVTKSACPDPPTSANPVLRRGRLTSGPTGPPTPLHYTKQRREEFYVQEVPTAVRLLIDQPFGKESNNHSFTTEAVFRHTLVFSLQSGYLDDESAASLRRASPDAWRLDKIVREHAGVDFRSLRERDPAWESEETIPPDRVKMVTACLIHFNFDMAATVRYIGNTHVGAHRNTAAILKTLKGNIPDDVHADLRRLYTVGAPNYCNAHSSEMNEQAFRDFGNHDSAYTDPDLTLKALTKDHKKGFCLAASDTIAPYVYNMHLTPIAIANIGHAYKKARFVFNSTLRPHPWCHAINDWTDKSTEPSLKFAKSFHTYLEWLWNLRITYPAEEIYLCDDDVAGAFRHGKYNPNLVGMHCVRIFNMLILMTGMTFGDNTSPSNWEPIALARQAYAMFVWENDADLVERAAPFTPEYTLTPDPTPEERAGFAKATACNLQRGVLNADGTRKPPPFPHHVDDNLWADIKEHLPRTLAATIWSLYIVLGFPDILQQDPLSWEKLRMLLSWLRDPVGRHVDSRRMTVGLTTAKRDILVGELRTFLKLKSFTIQEAAHIYGLLSDAAMVCRWAWPRFFGLRNAINDAITSQHQAISRHGRRKGFYQHHAATMPKALQYRIQGLVARDIAALVWRSKRQITMSKLVRDELKWLRDYLADHDNEWEISIGHVVQREAHGITAGDASHTGLGSVNHLMEHYIDCVYSDEIARRMKIKKASNPNHLHINHGEFIVCIFQVAAIIAKIDASPPGAYPPLMVWQMLTDNTVTKSWMTRVQSSSIRGQALLRLLSELLRRANFGTNTKHIPGIDNVDPDKISRIPPDLSPEQRHKQLLAEIPRLQSWEYFIPSATLKSLVQSTLYTVAPTGTPALPKVLGHFYPACSTTSSSFTI